MDFLKNKVNDVSLSLDGRLRGPLGNLGRRSVIADDRRSSAAFPQAVTQSSVAIKRNRHFSSLRERMGLCDKMPATLGL
jgi:hypothetical protein